MVSDPEPSPPPRPPQSPPVLVHMPPTPCSTRSPSAPLPQPHLRFRHQQLLLGAQHPESSTCGLNCWSAKGSRGQMVIPSGKRPHRLNFEGHTEDPEASRVCVTVQRVARR